MPGQRELIGNGYYQMCCIHARTLQRDGIGEEEERACLRVCACISGAGL